MKKGFEEFKKEALVSIEEICRDFYACTRESNKIKKEAVVVKNLENILNTTLKLSNEIGFPSMSLRDLSRETGLSMGALYAYFSSKDDLLKMIHSLGIRMTREILMKEIGEETETHEKLKKAVATHLFLSEIMQQWFYFFYMETKKLKPEDRKIPTESEMLTEQIFVDILEEGNRSGLYSITDTVLTGSVVKAMLQDWYLKRWKYRKRKISVEQYCAFVMSFIESFILKERRS